MKSSTWKDALNALSCVSSLSANCLHLTHSKWFTHIKCTTPPKKNTKIRTSCKLCFIFYIFLMEDGDDANVKQHQDKEKALGNKNILSESGCSIENKQCCVTAALCLRFCIIFQYTPMWIFFKNIYVHLSASEMFYKCVQLISSGYNPVVKYEG